MPVTGQPYPQAAARPHPSHHHAVSPGQQMILDLPRGADGSKGRIATDAGATPGAGR
jgi:hypothetical protein